MPQATAVEISTSCLCSNSELAKPMHLSSCFAARLSRSAKGPIPFSREGQDSHRGCTCIMGSSMMLLFSRPSLQGQKQNRGPGRVSWPDRSIP
jgi:hypothetical protein